MAECGRASPRVTETTMRNDLIKVLLVEDNPGDARLIRELLADCKTARFSLEWVDRLSLGLERLTQGGLDIVLLDLRLPDSNGIDTFVKIHCQAPSLPVIPLTGMDDEELAVTVVRAGAQDYLVKGEVDTNLLSSAIRYAIERKKTEEALRESEKRYRILFEATGTATVVVDQDSTIVLANAEFEKLSGYSKEELQGKMMWQDFVGEEEAKTIMEYGSRMIRSADTVPQTLDFNFIDRSGTLKSVFMTSTLVPGTKRFVASLLDVTERRKMEDELLKVKKLESVGILAGGIAHDFNNILTAILGNISLAKMFTGPGDKVYERLTEAEKGAVRAQELTRQLLTFSKGGAPVKHPTAIGELLQDTANFVLAGSNVRCRFDIAPDTWPVEVDEGQMSQVINNIVLNADQAMPSGGTLKMKVENVTLSGEKRYASLRLDDGRYVRISIEDQGVGIPERDLTKVFDPYFTTKAKGSGLGLSIAYSVVEKHGGVINVSSVLGSGTTFYIYLPAAQAKKPVQILEEDRLVSGRGKILVMDDEQIIRQLVEEMLSTLGYEGDFASEGGEAIELYKHATEAGHPYDAVIMDLTVPGGIGGKEAIKKLLMFDPKVKAIVSSGYANDPVMADYRKHGFTGVVAKPYRIQELSRTLRQVVESNG